jgi:hypothetical protein
MPITKKDFNDIDHKVITLMGMSGVGKTYLSNALEGDGWLHYSCDLDIGTKYLNEEIEQTLGEKNCVSMDDLSQLSKYVGRLGAPEQDGLNFDEFKRRQQKYLVAECQSLRALKGVIDQAQDQKFTHVINDSTGSLCEIDDDVLLDSIDENSLIVYIKANEEQEQKVLKRAQEYPKPLFFSPEKFDGWVEEYLAEQELASSADMDADDFSRWVFPKLFENRLPKYQAIADKYGVTIPSEAFQDIQTSDEFLSIIVKHLPEEYA